MGHCSCKDICIRKKTMNHKVRKLTNNFPIIKDISSSKLLSLTRDKIICVHVVC